MDNPLVNPQYLDTPVEELVNNNNNTEADKMPSLPIEPVDGEPRLRLAVKLPDGSRLDRYFHLNDQIRTVLDFASINVGHLLTGYGLRSTDSKYRDLSKTFLQCQIKDRTLLQLDPPDG